MSAPSELCRAAGVILALSSVPALVPAQTASVAGQIVDRATGRPLSDAQILVSGIPRGSRTADNGRYRITGVPSGTVDLRAIRIGYRSESRAVTVAPDATATADFALTASATMLDEVLVTATGETQRRRESGVSTGSIDTSQVNLATVQDFSDVVSSRVAGVVVQRASGTTGTSSRIRIRGSNSVNLPNDPLLVIDGIRVNNNPNSTSISVGGQTPSRFNDLDLDDVESIEILKGPAAAALFGTAAANGVILVTTKRGTAGPARTMSSLEVGRLNDIGSYPRNYAQIGTNSAGTARVTNCNLDAQVRGVCRAKPDSLVSTLPLENASPFRRGWRARGSTSVSGGSGATQYYLGTSYEREEGVYATNWLRKANLRGNINAEIRPTVQASVNLAYTSSRVRLPQDDNNLFGALSGALIGKAFDCHRPSENAALGSNDASCGVDTLSRGYRTPNHPSTRFFAVDTRQSVDRLLASTQAVWQAAGWLNMIGRAGVDALTRWDDETLPQGAIEINFPEGYRQSNHAEVQTYTANGSAVGTFRILPTLTSVSTAGAQYGREFFSRTDAIGYKLLPGTSGLGATSERFAVGESQIESIMLGVLLQQRIEWRDRLFVSAAVRADKNSNFGANLPPVEYPAAQLSWVISEEPFFPTPDWLNSLRLRAAYGESGQRPDFRQADRYFTPIAVNVLGSEVSGITLGGTGNPDLKPERTAESEFGFDAGLFGGRVAAEFQRYSRHTRDALIARRLAPSIGATTNQLVNLGRVDNAGYEYSLNVKPWNTRLFSAGVSLSGSHNKNRVVDLGVDGLGTPIPPILIGQNNEQRHQNGYPLGAYFGRAIVSFKDVNGDGTISRVNCPTYGTAPPNPQVAGGPACEIVLTDSLLYLGNPLGEDEVAVTPALSLGRWLTVQGLFDHRGGVALNNTTEFFRCNVGPNVCLAAQSRTAALADQARAISTLMGARGAYMEDASFWKWRELAVTVQAPSSTTRRLGVAAASLTLAGRNLKTWTRYTGLDPELNALSALNFVTSEFLTHPPVRYWIGRINLTF